MLADCSLDPWLGLAAAVVTAVGGLLTAVVKRQGDELVRIRGLLNGTRQAALREIEGLYRSRLQRGEPLRRHVDEIMADDRPV